MLIHLCLIFPTYTLTKTLWLARYSVLCSPGSVPSHDYPFKMATVFFIQCDGMSVPVYIYFYNLDRNS